MSRSGECKLVSVVIGNIWGSLSIERRNTDILKMKNDSENEKDEAQEESSIILENDEFINNFIECIQKRGGISNLDGSIQNKLKQTAEKLNEVIGFKYQHEAESSEEKQEKKEETLNKDPGSKGKLTAGLPCKSLKKISEHQLMKEKKKLTDNEKRKSIKKRKSKKEISSSDEAETTDDSSLVSEESDSDSLERESSDGSSDSCELLGMKQKAKCTRSAQNIGLKDLVEAMAKLDTRKQPKLMKFNENKGKSLKQYLEKFENYCQRNIKGSKYFWIEELEQYLTGSALQGFNTFKDQEDSYKKFKRRLLNWYKENKKNRKEQMKINFKMSKWEKDESLYLYSTKLKHLFKLAYPTAETKRNKKLINKLIESVPEKMIPAIKNFIFTKELKGKKVKFVEIQQCIKIQDRLYEDNHSERAAPMTDVVIQTGKVVESEENNEPKNDSNNDECNYYNKNNANKYFSDRPRTYNNRNYNGNNNQADANYNYRRPTQEQHETNNYCERCNKYGHEIANCRWALGLCFKCGSNSHRIRDCPQIERNQNWNQNYQRSHSTDPPSERNELPQKSNVSEKNLNNTALK